MMAIISCSKCGCSLDNCQSYFTRTNPTGVVAIWACAYPCGQGIPNGIHPVIAAVNGKYEEPIEPIPYVETPSIAALKANLFYAEALKRKAFDAHKDATISYYLALDALNQAIVKKNDNG